MLIYKKRSSNLLLFFIFLFAVFFFCLLFITPGFKEDIQQSIKIKLNQAVLFDSLELSDDRFEHFYYKSIYSIENLLNRKNQHKKIEINIPFEELEKIKNDRKKALKLKRLINPTEVNISIKFMGKNYKARARIKGDLSNHWSNNKQWSLRIELRNDKTIFGLNSFGLMAHENRDFPYNYLIEEMLKSYGLLNTVYHPVKVKLNGENWGIMLLEEQYSDSFFARNKIKEAPIFRFRSEINEQLKSKHKNIPNIDNIIKWQGYLDVSSGYKKVYKKTNIPGEKTNETLYSVAKSIHQSLELNQEEYFDQIINFLDVEKFAKAYAIISVFGSNTSLNYNNIRYYLNPYTLKLEPILRNHLSKEISENFVIKQKIFLLLSKQTNFKDIFIKTVIDIENNLELINKKNIEICKIYGKICEKKFNLEKLKKNIYFLKKNQFFIQEPLEKTSVKFNTINTQLINSEKLNLRAFNDGTLIISNLTSEKIDIDKFNISNSNDCKNCSIKIDHIILPSSFNKITNNKIQTILKSNKGDKGIINYSDENLNKFNQSVLIEDYKLKSSLIFKPPYTKINKNFIIKDDKYILTKGEYQFKEPLIIPAGKDLIVEGGSILKMYEGSYIEIQNGSLKLDGKNARIKILSYKPGIFWKGIYVNSNNKDSFIYNSEISNIDFFNNSLIQLTGGINFYNSNVEIKNSKFSNFNSEDAINLINSKFDIQNIEIKNTNSDAIDFDFSNGKVEKSTFTNIKGDALDFSGSNAYLKKLNLKNIDDKAISVGEESNIEISEIKITDSKFGIASKDSSKVIGKKILVENCIWYDFAAYQKKSFFNGGYINLKEVKGCNKSISQNKSQIFVNEKKVNTKKINVKDLYEGKYQ